MTATSSSSQTLLPPTSTVEAQTQQAIRDDQDEVIGRMDEDNVLPTNVDDTTVNNKMDDDDDINSESPVALDEHSSTTSRDTEASSAAISLLSRVSSGPTIPISISRNIDIPAAKNDSTMSYSVMETSSIGRRNPTNERSVHFFLFSPFRNRHDVSSDSIQC